MDKFYYILFLLLPLFVIGQNSPSELTDYYQTLKKAGYSDKQILDLAEKNGYEIGSLKEGTTATVPSNSTENVIEQRQRNQNDYSSYPSNPGREFEKDSASLEVFGSSYFRNLTYDFSPQINIATPNNYQLGPGDEITILLWGASEANYQKVITRQGKINIEGVGPISLNGLSLDQARVRIRSVLSKIYRGLNSRLESEKVNLDVGLQSTRSIFVNVVGQVNVPGLYTLNGMSSALHAIYAAGGIAENGGYRDIHILRAGKRAFSIDLYEYFIKGKLPQHFLRDQDVIVVPYYGNRIEIRGGVKNPGIFEVKKEEQLQDVLQYSGGIASAGVNDSFLLERIDGANYKTYTLSDTHISLEDGDKLTIGNINEQKTMRVGIHGEVLVPGAYSLGSVGTVKELLTQAKGFTEKAYREDIALFRTQKDGSISVIGINTDEGTNSTTNAIQLIENDSLVVYPKAIFIGKKSIFASGEVEAPGEKNYFPGMRIEDLVVQSEGLKIDPKKIDVIIKEKQENDYKLRLSGSLTELLHQELQQDEVITFVSKNNFDPIRVSITGEVKNQGVYVQSQSNSSVKELIEQAGGLTPFANLSGIYLKRQKTNNVVNEIINDSLLGGSEVEMPTFFVPISDLSEGFYFQDDDELVISSLNNKIEVSGGVLKPSVLNYEKTNATYYLNKAGISSQGSKRYVSVIYPNKEVYATKRFLFFNKQPKVVPGSEIVVGMRPERNKLSSQEVIGISSGLSTILIIVNSLISGQ